MTTKIKIKCIKFVVLQLASVTLSSGFRNSSSQFHFRLELRNFGSNASLLTFMNNFVFLELQTNDGLLSHESTEFAKQGPTHGSKPSETKGLFGRVFNFK